MSKITQMLQNYSSYIALPWREGLADAQRVIFCIYGEQEELALRAKTDEFELETKKAGHGWLLYDLTDSFAHWLVQQSYLAKFFASPQYLFPLMPRYLDFLTDSFKAFLEKQGTASNQVVAVMGVGTLFGFLRVRKVVSRFAPLVPGRLLVFFPGSHEQNNYRLLDGYDGFDYHAVAITAGSDFGRI